MNVDPTPNYPGPLRLTEALSGFGLVTLRDAVFTRDGPRADVEYRDLGLAVCTQGRLGGRHVRAILPFGRETGWHWHDMTGHFNYVLRGWIRFRYDGIEDEITARAGDCLSHPAGVPHNVVGRSDDLELIELYLPALHGTFSLEHSPVQAR
jgi:mannose-6-phosphate isomerase-like protein (cupin superfamily)